MKTDKISIEKFVTTELYFNKIKNGAIVFTGYDNNLNAVTIGFYLHNPVLKHMNITYSDPLFIDSFNNYDFLIVEKSDGSIIYEE